MNTIASVASGKLEGEERDGLMVFKGVPYAAPPVGELRWHPPQPLAPWSGVRQAKSFGPMAPQNSAVISALADVSAMRHAGRQDEDCLYLNIWTPQAVTGRLPVMVYIHGGGFERGSGASPLYDGASMARRGGVVYATINYRLGTLGFLRLADVTGGRIAATGNEAMLDQVAALSWIRDNIAAFGGDPETVTVFGESAGAMSIGTLMAMPAARGLFHRAILQSGACHTVVDVERANRVAEWLVRKLGVSPTNADALRAVPAAELLKATQGGAAAAPELQLSGAMFEPVIDRAILPRHPIDAVRAGSAREVAVIVGSTLEEMKLFAERDPRSRTIDQAGVRARLARHVTAAKADAIINTYRAARAERGDSTAPFELLSAIATDRWFRIPALRLAHEQSRLGAPAFNYLFTWRAVAAEGRLGACHVIDLPFVFNGTGLEGMEKFVGSGPAVKRLAQATNEAWTAFARTGNPSCEGLGDWPAYSETKRATMILGENMGVKLDLMERERREWDDVADASIGEGI